MQPAAERCGQIWLLSFIPYATHILVFTFLSGGSWSDFGCEVNSTDSDGSITCFCNHTTNYAVLMQIKPPPVSYSHYKSWLFLCSLFVVTNPSHLYKLEKTKQNSKKQNKANTTTLSTYNELLKNSRVTNHECKHFKKKNNTSFSNLHQIHQNCT